MSGIEAAQVINQHYPQISHIPIIAVTGRPRELWEETARAAGIRVYITKPALPSDIVKAITEFLPAASPSDSISRANPFA
jgi:CheY-like chemotaxis protein